LDAGANTRRLHLSVDGRIEGLTLELPEGWSVASAPDGSVQTGKLLNLGTFEGAVDILVNTTEQ
jgi:hypothetical protein